MAAFLFLPLELDSNISSSELLVSVNRAIDDLTVMGVDLAIKSFTPHAATAGGGIVVEIAGQEGWHLEHQLALNQQGLRCQTYP